MNLLVWTLGVPLVTAAIGGLGGPRKLKEAVMVGGLLTTFALCVATARQFNRHVVHLPLSTFSSRTLEKLRRFHVLNARVVRSWAARFIR